jgi:frataxin-like iron-binding protein CyaY
MDFTERVNNLRDKISGAINKSTDEASEMLNELKDSLTDFSKEAKVNVEQQISNLELDLKMKLRILIQKRKSMMH